MIHALPSGPCPRHRWSIRRALRWLALIALVAATPLAPGRAQVSAAPADLLHQLTQAETDINAVDKAMDEQVDPKDVAALRDKVQAARGSAADVTGQLTQQLALIDAKVAGLGTPAPGVTEAPDIRAQRASLAQQRSAFDSAVKRGHLLDVEAGQLLDEIQQGQAEAFNERVSARTPSPLSPAFWSNVLTAFPRDTRHVAAFFKRGALQIHATARHGLPWTALLGVVAAILLLFPARLAARRAGLRFLIEDAPGHRVRRSANALWRLVVGTLCPLLAAVALVQGLRWSNLAPPSWDALLDAFISAAGFSGFTASVTGALLMRSQPSWRIAPIGDDVAGRLRPFSLILAAFAFAAIMLDAFNTAVNASAAAHAAMQVVNAVLHLLLVGAALVAVGRLRAAHADDEDRATARVGLGALSLVVWLVEAVALVALLIGYIGLALMLVQLITWTAVLGAGTYLLATAVDDLSTTLFSRTSRVGQVLVRGIGLRASAVDQFGVLFSGVARLVLLLIAFGWLLYPFGAGGGVDAIFGRLGSVAQGVEVGGIAISPGAILRGLAVLFIGMALVRAFMRWLEVRYLPVTDLDGSGRNSVSLIARYVGIALAAVWALASLGIGVERIALLLSALSVGIGFGLQAITQNFVSGLILLAERPIKIGDLVRVGSDEGDVKRISVRSTEIELPDHSTLIVPNSELITKSVLNKTLSGPLGRIQLQFSVPLGEDVGRVRQLVLDAFAAEPAVLDDPAPTAFIDSIAADRVNFNCFAHVVSPRAAYRARSEILLALLPRFADEGIEVGTLPQKLEFVPVADSGAAPDAA